MFQTPDSSTTPSPTPTQPEEGLAHRAAAPLRLMDLADAEAFGRFLGRKALRSRRDGEALSALKLRLQASGAAGHASPALLEACARRLCGRVRATDIVASWQARHFGILLPGCRLEHADSVLSRLLQAAEGQYSLDGKIIHLRLQGVVMPPQPC